MLILLYTHKKDFIMEDMYRNLRFIEVSNSIESNVREIIGDSPFIIANILTYDHGLNTAIARIHALHVSFINDESGKTRFFGSGNTIAEYAYPLNVPELNCMLDFFKSLSNAQYLTNKSDMTQVHTVKLCDVYKCIAVNYSKYFDEIMNCNDGYDFKNLIMRICTDKHSGRTDADYLVTNTLYSPVRTDFFDDTVCDNVTVLA